MEAALRSASGGGSRLSSLCMCRKPAQRRNASALGVSDRGLHICHLLLNLECAQLVAAHAISASRCPRRD